uniref:Uncharacterized protein n=1 Tax=Oryza rufipogon TaxID=4529 RepID=A0A0E0QVR6_ORYRU
MSGGEERRGSGEVSEEEAVEGHRLGEERRGSVYKAALLLISQWKDDSQDDGHVKHEDGKTRKVDNKRFAHIAIDMEDEPC